MLKEYVSAGSAGREKGVPTPSRVPSRAVGTVGWAANEGSSGLPKATKSYQKRAFLPRDDVFADTLRGDLKQEVFLLKLSADRVPFGSLV